MHVHTAKHKFNQGFPPALRIKSKHFKIHFLSILKVNSRVKKKPLYFYYFFIHQKRKTLFCTEFISHSRSSLINLLVILINKIIFDLGSSRLTKKTGNFQVLMQAFSKADQMETTRDPLFVLRSGAACFSTNITLVC